VLETAIADNAPSSLMLVDPRTSRYEARLLNAATGLQF
jgi:hypothetical protein